MGRKAGRTSDDTRADVSAAARHILVTRGLRAVSAQNVGAAAGVAPSTTLDGGRVEDLLAKLTVAAFMPLIDQFAEKGSTDGWLVEAERDALKLLRADALLPLHVTQICGLAGEPPRKPGHLNHFTGLYREVINQLAAAFARDREGCDARRAAAQLMRFYMSAALHLTIWPKCTDEELFEIVG